MSLVISGAALLLSFRGTREAREPGIHTPQHQKENDRRAIHFDCGAWIPGSRPYGRAPE
jgi:hypothetical protein